MSEPRRYESAPRQGDLMSTSVAAQEAFQMLNAAAKQEWRGWGDTRTAARDRAARNAGVSPAQAERLWKNWQTMKYPNGDVYRLLRNRYGHLCSWIEEAADALEARRHNPQGKEHAVVPSSQAAAERTDPGCP